MVNRAYTTSLLLYREKSRSRIHMAAIHACADRSRLNPLRQFAQSFSLRSRQDSTSAQNIRRTPHPHVREIQTSLATPESPIADQPNLSPSFPTSPLPCRRLRAQRILQARSRPSARAGPSVLFQRANAARRRFFHACNAPDRSPQSFSPDGVVRPPTTPPDWPSFRRCTDVPEILSIRTSRRFPPRLPFPTPMLRVRHPARGCSD